MLSRQPGESMMSYVSRRRRWELRITALKSGMVIPEEEMAKQLLDCANISDNQQEMIKTLLGKAGDGTMNVHNFKLFADQLIENHGRIHKQNAPVTTVETPVGLTTLHRVHSLSVSFRREVTSGDLAHHFANITVQMHIT